jgi:predicted hotdog family 3-hydroxylacyl-ACP dehydratase
MPTPLPTPAQVLPHEAPMILIDELLAAGEKTLSARVLLRDDSPFLQDGRVSSMVVLEYMAQTIAAMAGLRNRSNGKEVQRGYLLGCRNLELPVGELRSGDEVMVEVEEVWSSDQLGQFRCSASRRGESVASGTLTVYQGELPEEKL